MRSAEYRADRAVGDAAPTLPMVEQCHPECPLTDARLDQLFFLGGCKRRIFDYLLLGK